jgi:hypothetical protein
MRARPFVRVVAICAALAARDAAAAVYDLADDWSDAANPNGVWSYREGELALPHVSSWEPGAFTGDQPGWARSGISTSRIPFWFKSSATPTFPSTDWQPGDVVVHSRDDANGVGTGEANVVWTSPVAARVDVTGSAWMARDIGRSNAWSLWHNGTLLTGGTVSSGDAYSRASPFDFAAGSGGAAALSQIDVSPGDQLVVRLERTSQYGDFVGVNLTVTTTPVPQVPILPLHASVLLCVLLALGIVYRSPGRFTLRSERSSGSSARRSASGTKSVSTSRKSACSASAPAAMRRSISGRSRGR